MPLAFLHFPSYSVFLGWLLFTLQFQLSKEGAREDQRPPVPAAKHQWIVVTSVATEVTEGAGKRFVCKVNTWHPSSVLLPNTEPGDGRWRLVLKDTGGRVPGAF